MNDHAEITEANREAARHVDLCCGGDTADHCAYNLDSIAQAIADAEKREREACVRRAVERAHDLGIYADKQQSIAAAIRGGK